MTTGQNPREICLTPVLLVLKCDGHEDQKQCQMTTARILNISDSAVSENDRSIK